MKENSIKNERSSIKEDIERLKLCSTNQCNICGRYEKEECMLERNRCEQHILSDYKRVLNELNKQQTTINKYAKENEELREKWDKDTHILQNELDLTNADKINNYIPIQKVKDNLIKYQEEYELLLEHQSGKESNRTKYLRGRIHMCQELLESEE